jgi:plastocyanin
MRKLCIAVAGILIAGSLGSPRVIADPSATAVRKSVQMTTSLDFQPRTVTIHRGDKVKWVNSSNGIHHTTTSNTGLWNSKDMAPGETFTRTFMKAGTFRYRCKYHKGSGMRGKVVVQP